MPFAADRRNRVEKKTSQFDKSGATLAKNSSLTMTRFGRKVLNTGAVE